MPVPTTTASRRPAGSAAPDLLRTTLRVDSWSTAVFGVVMLAGAEWLSGPLGLPVAWSVPFGAAMLGGAAVLALLARRPRVPARPAAAAASVNAVSCPALLLFAFTDVAPLTGPGTVFMTVGSVVVAVFAALEFTGLRHSRGRR
ncbi:hypothetical protein ACWDZ4_31795 [Streptomyces sp. NPDC003016]